MPPPPPPALCDVLGDDEDDGDLRSLKKLLSSVLRPLGAAVPSVHELEMLAVAASKG